MKESLVLAQPVIYLFFSISIQILITIQNCGESPWSRKRFLRGRIFFMKRFKNRGQCNKCKKLSYIKIDNSLQKFK